MLKTVMSYYLPVFGLLQATNSMTNEIVAIKKMNFAGKQSTEVSIKKK